MTVSQSPQTHNPVSDPVANPSSFAGNISLTKACEKQVCRLLEQESNHNIKLRIYIVGGGCSGFQYGFKLDDTENEDDIILDHQTSSETLPMFKIIIDSLSYQYLMGSEIDYVVNLQGARYVVRNPNAETTCGCGSSFSLKE